jgi:hypothetical protein
MSLNLNLDAGASKRAGFPVLTPPRSALSGCFPVMFVAVGLGILVCGRFAVVGAPWQVQCGVIGMATVFLVVGLGMGLGMVASRGRRVGLESVTFDNALRAMVVRERGREGQERVASVPYGLLESFASTLRVDTSGESSTRTWDVVLRTRGGGVWSLASSNQQATIESLVATLRSAVDLSGNHDASDISVEPTGAFAVRVDGRATRFEWVLSRAVGGSMFFILLLASLTLTFALPISQKSVPGAIACGGFLGFLSLLFVLRTLGAFGLRQYIDVTPETVWIRRPAPLRLSRAPFVTADIESIASFDVSVGGRSLYFIQRGMREELQGVIGGFHAPQGKGAFLRLIKTVHWLQAGNFSFVELLDLEQRAREAPARALAQGDVPRGALEEGCSSSVGCRNVGHADVESHGRQRSPC